MDRPDSPHTPDTPDSPDTPEPVHVVWFKRDLRVADHRPLAEAAERGPVLALFVYEPEILEGEDCDPAHQVFRDEALAELRGSFRARGGELVLRRGTLPGVFDDIRRQRPVAAIWSHEETGNRATYDRDLRVGAWAEEHGIPWHEIPQHGVIRRLRDRDGWAARWAKRMNEPVIEPPARIRAAEGIDAGPRLSLADLGLPPSERDPDLVQRGGEGAAHETLASFLEHRGRHYRREMSSPVTAFDACSRLSTHLAYGCLSIREAWHASRRRREELEREADASDEAVPPGWKGSLSSFEGRLRWHCHFMQKLEDEPSLEHRNLSRAYDGLRDGDGAIDDATAAARLEAWRKGETGYPMVDACMRALAAAGWINFRMRAMLMSFASYHLWLPWRASGLHLARLFVDYEPGIHWSQSQMQSGTTGINTLRIYSPAKQVKDQDPTGTFLRPWVPELEGVPDEHLAEPHEMPPLVQRAARCVIGRDYPAPLVDHRTAYREARRRVGEVRKTDEARTEAARVQKKHGSRRRPHDRDRARSRRGSRSA